MKKEKNVQSADGKNKKITLSVITGIFAGIINGLFGGGGGMVVVPMLTNLLKIPTKKAHATAILIILPMSVLSGILYAGFGNLNLRVFLPVSVGVIAGGTLGAFLLSKLSNKWLIVLFSLVMLGAGIKILFF